MKRLLRSPDLKAIMPIDRRAVTHDE
jgi:hypothetical protein